MAAEPAPLVASGQAAELEARNPFNALEVYDEIDLDREVQEMRAREREIDRELLELRQQEREKGGHDDAST